jgi:hypothetical protein
MLFHTGQRIWQEVDSTFYDGLLCVEGWVLLAFPTITYKYTAIVVLFIPKLE